MYRELCGKFITYVIVRARKSIEKWVTDMQGMA